MVVKGSLVRIGAGAVVYRVVRFTEAGGEAFLARMSELVDGGYVDARYVAGAQKFRTVDVNRLTGVTA
jgi:hypothetical protein